jgi:hypothetical protein
MYEEFLRNFHNFQRLKVLLMFLAMLLGSLSVHASDKDSLQHFGYEVRFTPGRVVGSDSYVRAWLKKTGSVSLAGEVHYSPLPSDSDAFASDFCYPTISLGLKYSANDVTLHRGAESGIATDQMASYDSDIGNFVSLYSSFSRPFFRNTHWEADYVLNIGAGYGGHKYNPNDNVDNGLTGSKWFIYFGIGFYAMYRISHDFGIKAGLEFCHHSNGALNRPNKGVNAVGPAIALCYSPYYESTLEHTRFAGKFGKYFYMDFSLGIGAKTLHEDWQYTQYADPSADYYRTDKFKLYAAYSMQADVMYRYARRWASGIGMDLFYGSYSSRVKYLDNLHGVDMAHSPWSYGIAAKHEVFYHQFSLAMALGVYLYREMGENAKIIEKPYYERIGLHYTFSHLGGLSIGCNVKAHFAAADYTEFVIGFPLKF